MTVVGEPEIRAVLWLMIDTQHVLVEGPAAVAIAAALQVGRGFEGQAMAVVSCGANISSAALAGALASTAPAS